VKQEDFKFSSQLIVYAIYQEAHDIFLSIISFFC